MKRTFAVAVAVAAGVIGVSALAQQSKPQSSKQTHSAVPYRWSSPLSSPAGQPLPSRWRSPMIAAPGETQPSRADEEKIRSQMSADGAKPWQGLDPTLNRIRSAVAGGHSS